MKNDEMNLEPRDGDFAKYLEERATNSAKPQAEPVPEASFGKPLPISALPFLATVEASFIAEPSAEELEKLRAFAEKPDLSEEELARQALEDPGMDGNVNTPE